MSRKSLSTLIASMCLSLSLVACGGIDASEEAPPQGNLASVEQNLEPLPACAFGDPYVYWSEVGSTCGACKVSRTPGQYINGYAACSSNVHGTRALISRTCQVCELL